MRVSVIFTTYNHPKWLEKVLWGFSVQTYRDFEIVIADDGSNEETREVIERVSAEIDIPVKHIWHEDIDFRKCQILNKAILASEGDYLIFTDGDCIPHPAFVENHVAFSEKGHFLSGGYFKLPMDLSRKITKEDILSGNATKPSWLLDNGLKFTYKISKLISSKKWGAVLDFITPTKATWNGHSASTFREYVLQTNGFDERMQYGGQDREFGERLMNMGIKGKQVRYRCSCVHLDHKRGYARQESIDKNRAIRKATRKDKVVRTAYGLDQYVKSMADLDKA
ncbi:glycosyltransferase family 2 protein [Algivirga pacifica]|uniref:Glycosyltransferase 2-like domain-containing protein n=1 Tax=Algivirga pacifica TaxID=1162670 RepID=A0ABP9D991_9BACT